MKHLLPLLLVFLLASCQMHSFRLDEEEVKATSLEELLTAQGLDEATTKDQMGWPEKDLLRHASWKGWVSVVHKLLLQGARVDSKGTGVYQGWTPLHWAARGGHTEVAVLLLEKGARVDSTDSFGDTPLHWAARGGHTAMAGLLLKRGAQVDSQNQDGFTPLHQAATWGHTAMAVLLLKRGAQVDSQNQDGFTPLHAAVRDPYKKRSIPVLKLLIDHTQDFHLKNNADQTALAIAEEKFKAAAKAKDAPSKKYYTLAIALLKKKKMRP